MEEEREVPRPEIQQLLEYAIESRGRIVADLEELQGAIKVIEKQARRLEKEIQRNDQFIEQIRAGGFEIKVFPRSNQFVNMSIPDAAAKAIEALERPLHVREILDVLESGGKRFDARRPTVSIASALSRDSRFVRVDKNTFDLVERTEPTLTIGA